MSKDAAAWSAKLGAAWDRRACDRGVLDAKYTLATSLAGLDVVEVEFNEVPDEIQRLFAELAEHSGAVAEAEADALLTEESPAALPAPTPTRRRRKQQ